MVLRSMLPAVRLEKAGDPWKVLKPDRYVDVVVGPSDRAGVEIDRPATEQPVVDTRLLEQFIDPSKRLELSRCRSVHSSIRTRLVPGRETPYVKAGRDSPELRAIRTSDMDEETRRSVVHLCVEAHGNEDFRNLFTYLPPEGLHVLAHLDDRLVGHAVVTTRWLQAGDGPLLRTAYVDAVSTSLSDQGRGIGSAIMQLLATLIDDFDIACLETDRISFYGRVGWEEWRGPLGGRSEDGLIPTPDQTGVMILRLPRTPDLDMEELLTVEANSRRIW